MKTKKSVLLLIGSLAAVAILELTSCWDLTKPRRTAWQSQKRWAWKPVYALDTSYRVIAYKEARPVITAGNIYVKDNYIYQCEVGAGIHVTDNANPAAARRVGFIEVPGCEEISIKGRYLYTNNYYDLVTIDIANLNAVRITSRVKNAFYANSGMPHSWEAPKDSGWFQCPDHLTDSIIVSWVKDSVFANCYKQ